MLRELAAEEPKKATAPVGPTGAAIFFGIAGFAFGRLTWSFIHTPAYARDTWEPAAGCLGTLICFALCAAAIGMRLSETRARRTARRYRGQDRYVCPVDLAPEERDLVVRAAKAVDKISSSQAHRSDLIDRQRNDADLPHILWKIALDGMRIYRLARDHREAERYSAGADVDAALTTQAAALRASREAVDNRVRALEAYAATVCEIDKLIDQQRQLEEAESRTEAYMDLVAATTADTITAEQVRTAEAEADALAGPLADAVRVARDAAELALPSSR
ncbi:hypothetical protein JL475_21045 [Streptomyces sp. M2CJ-2]|uniref:hypothetical protein n=1 Tax=Streptomyces sp. M2CJ-2 TaxID=2803948 RepID=UPI001927F8EA|nr:hypothetical protein [Streptomyces sp. M2CJ-2]MBL3668434.1 hypothetical protein [Streptomyces sp. M2CJ-2]